MTPQRTSQNDEPNEEQPSALERLRTFGSIDAADDFDPDSFVPSESWHRVLGRERPIVIGRKGTGKTAIRLALLDRAEHDPLMFVRDLRFRDYPWNVHNSIFSSHSGTKSRFLEPWLFLMLVELAKDLVSNTHIHNMGEVERAAAKGVRDFLTENWGSLEFDYRDLFQSGHYKVVKSFKVIAGSVEWEKVARTRLGDSLSAINRWLMDCLQVLIRADCSYYLVFDELDLDFSLGDETYADSMVGLLMATQNLCQWSRKTGTRAVPVVLIRDDIYRTLVFADKNKITVGLAEILRWDYRIGSSGSLKTVLDARLRVLLGLETDTEEDPWAVIFEGTANRRSHPYWKLVEGTYLRPRDLIQFANLCLEPARRRIRKPKVLDRRELIVDRDIRAAAMSNSTYLRNELNDEISGHYPAWQSWLELLRRIDTRYFRRTEFHKQCSRSKDLTGEFTATQVLSLMYHFGLIGFARDSAEVQPTKFIWSYRETEILFDESAPVFAIHPGLLPGLQAKFPSAES